MIEVEWKEAWTNMGYSKYVARATIIAVRDTNRLRVLTSRVKISDVYSLLMTLDASAALWL